MDEIIHYELLCGFSSFKCPLKFAFLFNKPICQTKRRTF